MRKHYMNAELPISERVEDLLAKMTTLEKICQLNCKMFLGNAGSGPAQMNLENGIGEMVITGSSPSDVANSIYEIQDYMKKNTRLGIPVLFHCEALSGPVIAGSQLFPTSITLGATFDPEIVRDMCSRTRRQMKAMGIRQALSPVVDIARDLRWGRVGETYGGDPTLCAAMGTAFVEGLQGEDLAEGVAATLKHFLGYSNTYGGLNMTRSMMDDREMRETFAKPFEAAIRLGKAGSVMNSYSEYNGKPICSSKEILTDLLRDDLGFDGLVVSDYMSVNRLVNCFHTAKTPTEAGKQCLSAGLDLECPDSYGYNAELAKDAERGAFDMAYIDRSVRRILKLKFQLGLFENPYPDKDALEQVFDNTENNRKAKIAAQKAITLTKNQKLLPLRDRKLRLAVIGPMGNAPRAHYAAYTWVGGLEMAMGGGAGMAGVEEKNVIDLENGTNPLAQTGVPLHAADDLIRCLCPQMRTVYEALRERFETVSYVEGCDYRDAEKRDFESAICAAKAADIVVCTVGGRNGWGLFNTGGEGVDTADIGLPGAQEDLVKAVYAVNPRMIVVHTDCRPLVSEWIYDNVPAVIEGWLGCTFGGSAIAEAIAGEINPGGRLQIDVPGAAGSSTMAHYLHNGTAFTSFSAGAINKEGYIDIPASARLPFGYGLSYTDFAYSDFNITMDEQYNVCVRATITNTGNCAGDEVVQLYGADKIASLIRPEQELLGFRRISLHPGEAKTVQFKFNLDQFAFRCDTGKWIIEAGEFEISLKKNSKELIYTETLIAPDTVFVDYTKRSFFARTEILHGKQA